MVEFTSSPYNLQENKTIDRKLIESSQLVDNVRQFSSAIAHSRCYVNPRDGNIKTIILLITVIKLKYQ